MSQITSEHRSAFGLFLRQRHGVLSTAHAQFGGWPFGSIAPYAVGPRGDPVLYLSDIAEHSKNLAADPRASLLVEDAGVQANPQAGARVTLLARARRPEGADREEASAAYFARFPEARAYASAHGFAPLILEVERVRWILGFGSMGWIGREHWGALATSPDPLAAHAQAILEHMNRDHAGAVAELAASFAALSGSAASMTGVDSLGFTVEVSGPAGVRRARIDFPRALTSPEEVRRTLIAMLAEGRSGKAPS